MLAELGRLILMYYHRCVVRVHLLSFCFWLILLSLSCLHGKAKKNPVLAGVFGLHAIIISSSSLPFFKPVVSFKDPVSCYLPCLVEKCQPEAISHTNSFFLLVDVYFDNAPPVVTLGMVYSYFRALVIVLYISKEILGRV